jgi:hypothetical protein
MQHALIRVSSFCIRVRLEITVIDLERLMLPAVPAGASLPLLLDAGRFKIVLPV